MTKMLFGKPVSEEINATLALRVEKLRENGINPTLVILKSGDRPGDIGYAQSVMRMAEQVGVGVRQMNLDDETFRGMGIRALNDDNTVHGVLIFRPLPKEMGRLEEEIRNNLDVDKDVDGMTIRSMAGVYSGEEIGFAPCTAEACIKILDYYGVEIRGKNAVVVGRSVVVGRPLAMMLLKRDATVTICHTKTQKLAEITKKADILITAAGALGMIGKEAVREGQIVIDVAMNWDEHKTGMDGEQGGFTGDVKLEEVAPIVEAITPVPGGVGLVTTSVLLEHVVKSAEIRLFGKV